uniref:Putative ovule protein n=1 Tax=Solanum chacoense TaxID=4108 RepID=A0A0V0H026_SOLCH
MFIHFVSLVSRKRRVPKPFEIGCGEEKVYPSRRTSVGKLLSRLAWEGECRQPYILIGEKKQGVSCNISCKFLWLCCNMYHVECECKLSYSLLK